MSVENFAKANSPPTEQAHAVLARSRSCCHRATTSTVVRRFFRGTASLYIFSILFSRKSRVPLDAAFSYLFLFIPRLLFSSAGIISSARIHPQLAFLCRRDDFFCAASSLSCSFLPQGLFLPPGFIPILLFCAAGMISSAQMHPQLAFFFRRDDFFCSDASPACFFLPQGLLLPPGFISILLFSSTGIIATARIHLYLALLCRRDDFFCADASPACFFVLQGLFPPPGFIPGLLFSSAGMISAARIHPYLALFIRRDYF